MQDRKSGKVKYTFEPGNCKVESNIISNSVVQCSSTSKKMSVSTCILVTFNTLSFVKIHPEFFPLQSPCSFLAVPSIASLTKCAQVQQSFRIAFNLLVKLHITRSPALHSTKMKSQCQCIQSIIHKVG